MNTKKILAITTITIAATSFANAQIPNQGSTTNQGMGNRIMQNLTDDQKKVMDEARSLFESGKKEEAKALLEKNNLKPGFKKGHMKNGHKIHENRKAIEDAIVSGNYQNFLNLASTTPLAKIDQNTFNLLTPQFKAKINAQEQIKSILKGAGIEAPVKGQEN